MANSFCRHLSNSYRFTQQNGQLEYSPCCITDLKQVVFTREQLLKAQRAITVETEKNPEKHCAKCLATERAQFRNFSRRQWGLKSIPADAVDSVPYTLEIQIDTSCNAACTICGPHYSTLWKKQLNQFDSKTYELKTQHHYDRLPELIDFSTLTEIRFFGGDPFFGSRHLQVLSYIPDPSRVELLYSTNGSIKPTEEEFEFLRKFKKITLIFSIDDIGDRFTYVRWPLKWSTVESNIIYFYNNLPNIEIKIHSTVNPMTLWYVPELEEWVKSLTEKHNIAIEEHSLNPCRGDWGIDGTPPGLRNDVLTRYSVDHPIAKILNEFKETPDKFKNLENNMNFLDQQRDQNWKECFPEVVNYFIVKHTVWETVV